MLRTNETKGPKQNTGSQSTLLTMAASLVAMLVLTPGVNAQECKDGSCKLRQPTAQDSRYRFQVGQARYDYPSYSEERFPEFEHLRTTPTSRYREVAPRMRSDRDYLARDEYRQPGRSNRDADWRRYNDEPVARDRRRDERPSRDFFYSGYDNTGARRSRPTDDLRSGRDLRELRNQLEDYHRPRQEPVDRYNSDRPYLEFDQRQPTRQPARRPGPRQDFGSEERRYQPRQLRDFQDRRYESLPAPGQSQDATTEPTLDQKVTSRYSNANVARFAGTVSANQGLALFQEVSTLIDQRHLAPKTYTERLQNGVRNIAVATQNRTFRRAVPMPASEAQLSQFRSELGRLANRNVQSRTDAEQVVRSAMQLGSQVGLRPGLVAYEFANASVQSLDKYSGLDPSTNRVSGDLEDANTKTAMLDEYVTGVGIEIRQHAEGLEIVRVLRGGPAVAAGIQTGDIIRQINDRNIGGTDMNTSVAMISGSAGTQVRMLVAREGRGTKVFSLVRRRFRVFTVNDVKMVDRENGVGYLHLNKFASDSAAEMEQAIQDLRSQGMQNLIVDVRGNPGGLLTTAIEVSDKFLRCGRIVATRGRLATDNSVESASANGTWSMPLVVLVDGDSASASEIFAAAIQENGRGIVVGEKSYGKGTVQTHFPLSSGLGTVRLTTAKFYSPTDREMAGAGVSPDVRANDDDSVMAQAVTAASHPRLAEMVAQHGTCRPAGTNFRNFGSAERPVQNLSIVLNK